MAATHFSGPVHAGAGLSTGATPGTGDLVATKLHLASSGAIYPDDGTASATAGAATLNKAAGVITTEALTTAAAAIYTLTLTNSMVAAGDMVFASVQFGTNTQGDPTVLTITPGAGSVVIKIKNTHATLALNGTLKIAFIVHKA